MSFLLLARYIILLSHTYSSLFSSLSSLSLVLYNSCFMTCSPRVSSLVLLAIFLAGLIVRATVGLWGYSGAATPPMYELMHSVTNHTAVSDNNIYL
jgi:hypothetical protein